MSMSGQVEAKEELMDTNNANVQVVAELPQSSGIDGKGGAERQPRAAKRKKVEERTVAWYDTVLPAEVKKRMDDEIVIAFKSKSDGGTGIMDLINQIKMKHILIYLEELESNESNAVDLEETNNLGRKEGGNAGERSS